MDIAPNVPPHAYALLSLMRSHLRHLEKVDAEPLATPQWTAAAESARTVAGIKYPGEAVTAQDIPMIVGTGAPQRRRHLYCSMPCTPAVAAKADECEVAIFTYNRRGRIQPANRTADERQSRAWYPPAKAIAPMRLIGNEAWEPVVEATGESGRPGVFEAASGWLVLLLLIAFLGTSAYFALRFTGII
ncbi:hypothetical protein L0U85_11770 [Glycomyces sp. L485]|uniref:hypothetical protein n=1 Tax=Glycomyces sp. L485 TaxID=2909235 RepID=UPI001F4ADD89|nr:hypothetical protein [Glycomyces sp. L485]MCH7231522.1 hypothetical protein [Glycomyces sp. L485]